MLFSRGFTLVEKIFVVTVLALLAAAAQAVYMQGITKARDVDRIITLENVGDIISYEIMESNAIFASQAEFAGVLDKYGYDMTPQDDLCYFIASIPASQSPSGHAEYVVATWGELTSTKDSQKGGILAIGTSQAVNNLIHVNINQEEEKSLQMTDFSCSDPIKMLKIERAFLGDPIFSS